MLKKSALSVLALGLASTTASAQTEIQWWHAMTGANNDVVNRLAEEFNASQKDYKVIATFKGSYPETLNAGIAAFRSGNAPHIMQVFEVGTATMMAAKGAIKPVQDLMKEAGEPFDPKSYLPAITGYYSTAKGEMLSMPFNSSSMVMWYNKDALKKAGLNPDQPPKTWPEVFEAAKKMKAAGYDQVRLHDCMDDLGQYRAALGLAQRSDQHEGQRPRRFRHGTEDQLAPAREASAEPRRSAEG
jgi:sn-glycerol 3-phosphate transport system substrate-binding protein